MGAGLAVDLTSVWEAESGLEDTVGAAPTAAAAVPHHPNTKRRREM